MKITSWNVNGLRTIRPLAPIFSSLSSDIICLQETKISGSTDPELESMAFVKGYDSFFSICQQKRGYSGVATFTRRGVATPFDAGEGLSDGTGGAHIRTGEHVCDDGEGCICEDVGYDEDTLRMVLEEGRCVITDHGHFVLINVYVPAVSVEERVAFKLQFLHALRAKIDALKQAGRKVVAVGDFNICPAAIDNAEPIPPSQLEAWERGPSRTWLRELLKAGYVDTFREMHPRRTDAFTCWSEATRGRENNYGVRIDLIVADRGLLADVTKAHVMSHIKGSDHCPVTVEMQSVDYKDAVPSEPPAFCSQYIKRFTKRQRTLKDMFAKGSSATEKVAPSIAFATTGSDGDGDAAKSRAVLSKRTGGRPEIQGPHKRKMRHTQSKLSTFFAQKSSSDIERSSSDPTSTAWQQHERDPKAEQHSSETPQSSAVELTQQSAAAMKRRKETAKAWRKILTGPPPPPLCRHGIPCVLKTVGKSGENKGRTFYSCPYPSGIGKTSDCKFFKWAPYKAGLNPFS